jgi:hypothetical protein
MQEPKDAGGGGGGGGAVASASQEGQETIPEDCSLQERTGVWGELHNGKPRN